MFRNNWFFAGALVLLLAGFGRAQDPKASAGIPINHQLTIDKCGGCHQRDASGMMRRLSYMRTTPEVWEQAIKRMVRLNGVVIRPEEAREILRYLSNNNGLAPEEAKPLFWEAEHRMFRDQSDKIPADALQHTCNYCHTIGRVLTQRRTKDDYEKLINMHLGLFPGAENVLRPRRPTGPTFEAPVAMSAPTGGNPAVVSSPAATNVRSDGKYPADVAIEYLATAQPLITPDWSSWSAVMRTPKLEGKWMIVGYQQGKGRIFGTMTIEAGPSAEDFTTKIDIEYAATGATLSRTGKGVVYTGYSWRGRSTTPAPATPSGDPASNPSEWREALFVARDGNSMEGRWFWGGYDEFGIDARLTRIGTAPVLVGASVFSLQSPSSTELKVYGANFPAELKPADFDFGPGITVSRVMRRTASVATITVQVSSNLASGIRDISLGRSTAEREIAIYDKVAYIKALPDASMARLGGAVAPKQYAQFEAIAYAAGADGKPQTADDIPLGPVPAHWSMSEFVSTPEDDDVKFVGSISDAGMFTPNIEGPNSERKKQANNFATNNWGDVWIEASYDPPGGKPIKARSYLVVTIPVYVRYDQPEVATSAVDTQAPPSPYRQKEFHAFESAGTQFLYLVPSGAIFSLDKIGREILDCIQETSLTREELVALLLERGYELAEIDTSLMELEHSEVVARGDTVPEKPRLPGKAFPLQRVVLNITNQCNLACTYCYEYSADKISNTEGKPKFMTSAVAEASIDMLIKESGDRPSIHVTFFGGETLLNFPMLRSAVDYAKQKCAEASKQVEFSLTTNATLLTEQVVDFLAEHKVGVTVSIDGDRELHDKMRTFSDGRGSYDLIVPRIKMLLQRHKTNSIGARVTLSSGVSHVRRIYEHLTQEIGFYAVGFSPATANPSRLYSIGEAKMDSVLSGFEELAWEYRDWAIAGRHHGFTNVNDTLKELHSGMSKAYPCGAGLGLLGVGTAGDINLCHRFVDSDVGQMGHVQKGGVDQGARDQFLNTHHIGARYDCHTCWARPVCAGGCYHEAFIHYGDTSAATLHYCDWIRGWNDLCLRIYGEISLRNPSFLDRFAEN